MSEDGCTESDETMGDPGAVRNVSEMSAEVKGALEGFIADTFSASDIIGILEGNVTDIFADVLSEYAEENPDAVEDLFGYTPVWDGGKLVGWALDGETFDTRELSDRLVEANPFLIDDFCEGLDGSVDVVDLLINAPDGLYERMLDDWTEGMPESDHEALEEIVGNICVRGER